MEFELNEDQKMIRDMVRKFANEKIKPGEKERDQKSEFPDDSIIEGLAEQGLFGVYIPEEYGGADMDVISYAIAVEELSRVSGSVGVIVSAHTSLACDPVLSFGTEEQKKKYLTPMAEGEALGCLALTEPDAGSDVLAGKTTAKLEGDKYILNGSKNFITNGPEAKYAITTAITDKEAGHKGLSAFIVDKDFPGYSIGKHEDKLGIRSSSTSEIIYENCEVPKENLLGKEGEGFKVVMKTLDGGRIGIAAQAVGIAQAALEDSIEFAKTRVQFGKPIAKLQAIQWMIADMSTQIEAARLLTYRAAYLKDKGARYSKEAAMAKLFASEASHFAAHKGIQIHGGYGFVKEYNAERYYRDARITEIYEGTSEIMRLVIAGAMLR